MFQVVIRKEFPAKGLVIRASMEVGLADTPPLLTGWGLSLKSGCRQGTLDCLLTCRGGSVAQSFDSVPSPRSGTFGKTGRRSHRKCA